MTERSTCVYLISSDLRPVKAKDEHVRKGILEQFLKRGWGLNPGN
ncbi:hypothetical protein D068_cds25820 [Bacillus atrophaeus UCMB-5137]|nr:hypothetical protein D068_cds25820 [Bacillus atrophaeus UCMB-5137]